MTGLRRALGAVLALAGVAAFAWGIAEVVSAGGRIEDDAVGRATVRALGELVGEVEFRVPAGERRDFSVYLLFGGVERNSDVQELAVRDTGCVAVLPDGATTRFRGARQGTSATIGDAASVGHFSSQPGRVRVRCAYLTGTPRSERSRPAAVPFVVTPGTPGAAASGALWIVGGVFAALAGGFLTFWRGRSRRSGSYQR